MKKILRDPFYLGLIAIGAASQFIDPVWMSLAFSILASILWAVVSSWLDAVFPKPPPG